MLSSASAAQSHSLWMRILGALSSEAAPRSCRRNFLPTICVAGRSAAGSVPACQPPQ
jgi:hypothetical protein